VDAVVHSLKDLPTASFPGLAIGAIPKREDPRDALCARDGLTIDTLPVGARVGTGSPRRVAQLLSRRPDIEVVDIRGNVDTRLGKIGPSTGSGTGSSSGSGLDAVILAAAGLSRLGRLDAVTEFLAIDGWPTAPGQGAVAVEVRAGEEKLVSGLDHRATRINVEAEREVLALLEAGCAAPVGAHAFVDDGLLFLSARVYALDGSTRLTSSHALYLSDVKQPGSELAARVARELLDAGAASIAPLGTSE
jgi:hydroxymethylbilane synthase